MSSGLIIILPKNYLLANHIFNIYKYIYDLALNNLQGLICLKTKPINLQVEESENSKK